MEGQRRAPAGLAAAGLGRPVRPGTPGAALAALAELGSRDQPPPYAPLLTSRCQSLRFHHDPSRRRCRRRHSPSHFPLSCPSLRGKLRPTPQPAKHGASLPVGEAPPPTPRPLEDWPVRAAYLGPRGGALSDVGGRGLASHPGLLRELRAPRISAPGAGSGASVGSGRASKAPPAADARCGLRAPSGTPRLPPSRRRLPDSWSPPRAAPRLVCDWKPERNRQDTWTDFSRWSGCWWRVWLGTQKVEGWTERFQDSQVAQQVPASRFFST